MVSPRRRFGSERIVYLVGFSTLALALAPLRADAQPSYWPVRKAVPSSGVGNVEIYPNSAATTSEDLIFNADEGTQIVADGAVVASDLLVIGHDDGISARIKVLEEKLAQVRTNYNAISLDDLTAADDHCKINVAQLKTDVSDLEAQVAKSPNVVIPPECDGTYVAGLRREEISGVNQWTCACKYEYSGDNCVTPSCDLSTFGYDTTAAAVVSSTCGLNEGYLKAGDSCEYSCADGYMPNTFTATNTARRIDCEKVDPTTVTTKAGTPTTPANITVDANSALTCVTCDSTGFTNYTGNNCKTPSCLVNSVLSNDNNVIDSTCGDSMKAGESCQYSCDDGFMPTGLNQATETGQSRTLTCASGGGTITATGYTAGNDEPACTACTGGRTGINCVNAGS